ncbi:hypothetical protein ABZX12_26440 [Kribbella sp. NPDC003505]|uniref:hypothetical protein n=1 Tax=Kribbella sp. NPDC003505 TaxID=3154448 RepID=UPI0033B388E6
MNRFATATDPDLIRDMVDRGFAEFAEEDLFPLRSERTADAATVRGRVDAIEAWRRDGIAEPPDAPTFTIMTGRCSRRT